MDFHVEFPGKETDAVSIIPASESIGLRTGEEHTGISYGRSESIAPGFRQNGEPEVGADDDVDEVSPSISEKPCLPFRIEMTAVSVKGNPDPGGSLRMDGERGGRVGRKAAYAL